MIFDYQPLQPGEEPTFFDTVGQALNFSGVPWQPYVERIGLENLRAIRRQGRIIGGLGVYRMGQWFGGRSVPCGGVSAVGIAPEVRGQGAAKFALTSLLQELHTDGTPIASLYPSTQRLYRSVGFEQAGSRCRYRLPLSFVNRNDRELPMTPVPGDDCEPFLAIANERARRTNGNLARTPGMWQRIRQHPDQKPYACLIGEVDDPEGYIFYRQAEEGPETRIVAADMAALTPAASRRLWTFLLDHRSIPTVVQWVGPPTEPLLGIPQECDYVPSEVLRWMLRIVNVPAALTERGYPPDVDATLHLDIIDELLPANHGRFVLRVHDGRGEVSPGGNGDLRSEIRGLAPLYSSFLAPDALRSIGWLDGDDAAMAIAARIFAGPEPWMPEMF